MLDNVFFHAYPCLFHLYPVGTGFV